MVHTADYCMESEVESELSYSTVQYYHCTEMYSYPRKKFTIIYDTRRMGF